MSGRKSAAEEFELFNSIGGVSLLDDTNAPLK